MAYQWFFVTIIALLLALPRPATAQDEQWRGILTARPAGVTGAWVVGERTVTATDDTTLHEDNGPLDVGVCATLEVAGEWAMSIASEPPERCAGSEGNTTPPPDVSRWIGTLISRPEGVSGPWEFDTRTITAIASTQLVEEHGPLDPQRCTLVHFQRRGAALIALRIESQPESVCAGNAPPAQPTPPPDDARCFDEVPHCISGRIREYWEQNGGLPVFGFPITPQQQEMIEGERYTVQWFERNRLELHPENDPPYDVLLGRLGVDVLEQQGRDWFSFPRDDGPREGCRFAEETGYNVCGDILAMWRSNGLEIDGEAGTSDAESLALFGLPVSPPMRETLHDGQEYTVQWFERARFELHPENEPPYHVLLGLLGNELSQTSDE